MSAACTSAAGAAELLPIIYIKCKVLRICATRWRYYSVCFDVVVVRVGRVKWAPIRWVHRRLGSSTGEELWRRPGWAAKRPPENCRTRGKTDTTCLDPNRVLPFISINKMQTKLGLFNYIYFLITFFTFIAEEQCCKKVVCEQIKIQIQIPILVELAFEDISKNPALNGPERCGGGCVPRWVPGVQSTSVL